MRSQNKTTLIGGILGKIEKKHILLVEDEIDWQMIFIDVIGERAIVDTARSEVEAYKLFRSRTYDLMVLDGNISQSNSLGFIRFVRKSGYTGPMVACSADSKLKQEQMANGCDHAVELKYRTGNLVLKLLGLS